MDEITIELRDAQRINASFATRHNGTTADKRLCTCIS